MWFHHLAFGFYDKKGLHGRTFQAHRAVEVVQEARKFFRDVEARRHHSEF
jgi:hypothetical protein